jgi:hypothetical protein
MRTAIVAAALVSTFGQASLRPYTGTWTAELAGKPFVHLELTLTNNVLNGTLRLANLQVDAQGAVNNITSALSDPSPIFDIGVQDSRLSFSRRDVDDIDHFELRVTGSGAAELRWVLTDADRQEFADNGIAVPQPIPLKRIAP